MHRFKTLNVTILSFLHPQKECCSNEIRWPNLYDKFRGDEPFSHKQIFTAVNFSLNARKWAKSVGLRDHHSLSVCPFS